MSSVLEVVHDLATIATTSYIHYQLLIHSANQQGGGGALYPTTLNREYIPMLGASYFNAESLLYLEGKGFRICGNM